MIDRLLVFFALVYVVEGVGQVEGLIAQPLSFYLKEVHGWTALEVSAYLAIFNFPWIIKPLYGAFSDFVPLLGYRRKPYLLAANIVAAGAFLWLLTDCAGELLWAFGLTAYAMAMSSTVCGAVLVENGQRLGESGDSSINSGCGSTPPRYSPRSRAARLLNACHRPRRCMSPRPSWRSRRWRSCSGRYFSSPTRKRPSTFRRCARRSVVL